MRDHLHLLEVEMLTWLATLPAAVSFSMTSKSEWGRAEGVGSESRDNETKVQGVCSLH